LQRACAVERAADPRRSRRIDAKSLGNRAFNAAPYPTILVKDLTWSGHDLAAVMENETVWGQFKQRLSPSELVQIPLPVLKNVGIGLLTTWLKSQF
jgi:hypothetical protein